MQVENVRMFQHGKYINYWYEVDGQLLSVYYSNLKRYYEDSDFGEWENNFNDSQASNGHGQTSGRYSFNEVISNEDLLTDLITEYHQKQQHGKIKTGAESLDAEYFRNGL